MQYSHLNSDEPSMGGYGQKGTCAVLQPRHKFRTRSKSDPDQMSKLHPTEVNKFTVHHVNMGEG